MFRYKTSSKNEAYLLKGCGFKKDWFNTVIDKRPLDWYGKIYFEFQFIQLASQNYIQSVQNYFDYTFSHAWAVFLAN